MTKMLFRNVFSIFKLEVKNCGPQSTVLNTIKIHVYSCFSASLKNHVRVMLLHGDNFQPSRDWPSSWRMHPSSGAPYSPRFLILTRIAFTSCLHPYLAPPHRTLDFRFATSSLNIWNKTHYASTERPLCCIPNSLRKLQNFSLSATSTIFFFSCQHLGIWLQNFSILPCLKSYNKGVTGSI